MPLKWGSYAPGSHRDGLWRIIHKGKSIRQKTTVVCIWCTFQPGKRETNIQSNKFTTGNIGSPTKGPQGVRKVKNKEWTERSQTILDMGFCICSQQATRIILPSFLPHKPISRRVSTELISYLPLLYTQKTESEVHNPQGPNTQQSAQLLWQKIQERTQINHRYTISESGNCVLTRVTALHINYTAM